VPVVEAHIPAAAAGRRIACSPTRSTTGAWSRDWASRRRPLRHDHQARREELFVGATFMNMSWGPDAIIITALVG
jgi:hypothetical protein